MGRGVIFAMVGELFGWFVALVFRRKYRWVGC